MFSFGATHPFKIKKSRIVGYMNIFVMILYSENRLCRIFRMSNSTVNSKADKIFNPLK